MAEGQERFLRPRLPSIKALVLGFGIAYLGATFTVLVLSMGLYALDLYSRIGDPKLAFKPVHLFFLGLGSFYAARWGTGSGWVYGLCLGVALAPRPEDVLRILLALLGLAIALTAAHWGFLRRSSPAPENSSVREGK